MYQGQEKINKEHKGQSLNFVKTKFVSLQPEKIKLTRKEIQ